MSPEQSDAAEIAAALREQTAALREQLERLRRLVDAFPGESAFAMATEHLEAALGQLAPETFATE